MEISSIAIIANDDKDPEFAFTRQIVEFLNEKGIASEVVATSEKRYPSEDHSFWITLGGDGTMLRYVPQAVKYDTPVMGINLGTMGFLTDAEKNEGIAALEKILNGQYKYEERLMLVATVSEYSIESNIFALNEVCVGGTGNLKTFSVVTNDIAFDIRADGIIISSPTGSTAYNLSAGGPLLAPSCDVMVITPLNSHSLNARSLVIGEKDLVSIIVNQDTSLIADGHKYTDVLQNKLVSVTALKKRAKIIRTTEPANLFETLKRKKIL